MTKTARTEFSTQASQLDVEQAVRERYSTASQEAQPALCCPIDYDPGHLAVLPQELLDRDYGCGDPSKYVDRGERVLDLGSGGGKICYIASQIVGPEGAVIGVNMNDDMLSLARRHRAEIAERIGWDNVSFYKGRIQDLSLDLERFESYLQKNPVTSSAGWDAARQWSDSMRQSEPMIASDSVDVVISNCVLNLVDPMDRRQLFGEIFRVLRRGGRAVISDIVCDEPVPEHLQLDPTLWSGCISGAFPEHDFVQAFAAAGFYGMEIVNRQEEPWAKVEGIEFRSLTIQAMKGKEGPCRDHHQAVIYRGPWSSVIDDDGHVLRRGERMAVCEKTFEIYTSRPYQDDIIGVAPAQPVPAEAAKPFDCHEGGVRDPKVTKSADTETLLPLADCCGGGQC